MAKARMKNLGLTGKGWGKKPTGAWIIPCKMGEELEGLHVQLGVRLFTSAFRNIS